MDPAGPVAEDIADLTLILVTTGSIVFLVVVILLGRALLGERDAPEPTSDRPMEPERPAHELSGVSRRLVIGGGVVLPTVVIVAMFGWTLETMRDLPSTTDVPDGAMRIDVTARQWWWDVQYPGSDVRSEDVIHIPVGRQIALVMSSVDVIHSLWIPRLAGKLDVLPDHPNTLVFSADEPGEYFGQCAEFCGLGHSEMELRVVALPADEFDRWLAAGGE